MKRALVVKALTNQILLVRTDSGEILSMSVFCRNLPPGTILQLDRNSGGCHIRSINGEACSGNCGLPPGAVILEHSTTEMAQLIRSSPGTDENTIEATN